MIPNPFSSLRRRYNVKRYRGAYIDYEWVEELDSEFIIEASIEPVPLETVTNYIEGYRSNKWYKLIVDNRIILNSIYINNGNGDIVEIPIHRGDDERHDLIEQFRVIGNGTWNNSNNEQINYSEYLLIRLNKVFSSSPDMAKQLAALYKPIGEFIKGALNDNSVTIYRANPDAPTPFKPYVNMAILSMPKQGSNLYETVESVGDTTKQFKALSRRVSLRIQSVSDLAGGAVMMLRAIENSFYKNSLNNGSLANEGTFSYLDTIEPITLVPSYNLDGVEDRATMTVSLNMIDKFDEDVIIMKGINPQFIIN